MRLSDVMRVCIIDLRGKTFRQSHAAIAEALQISPASNIRITVDESTEVETHLLRKLNQQFLLQIEGTPSALSRFDLNSEVAM